MMITDGNKSPMNSFAANMVDAATRGFHLKKMLTA
jgi:hypothetical protein